MCPVVAHKLGGAGTRRPREEGVRADLAINMEHSALTIANVCVGIVMVRIRTRSPELFFRSSAEARARYWNPIEQQHEIMRRVGPSLEPIPPGRWLAFTRTRSCRGSRRTPSTRSTRSTTTSRTTPACPAASAT